MKYWGYFILSVPYGNDCNPPSNNKGYLLKVWRGKSVPCPAIWSWWLPQSSLGFICQINHRAASLELYIKGTHSHLRKSPSLMGWWISALSLWAQGCTQTTQDTSPVTWLRTWPCRQLADTRLNLIKSKKDLKLLSDFDFTWTFCLRKCNGLSKPKIKYSTILTNITFCFF